MARGRSLLLGMVIGGTAGAVATLLSTPSSGKDLRQSVKNQSLECKSLFDNLIQDAVRLKDQIAITSKEGAVLIGQLAKEIKSSVEDWKLVTGPHQENIHEYLEQIEVSLKELEDKIKEN